MERAFVLINSEMGYEGEVIKSLKEIEQVKEVNGTFGAYDIIAKVEGKTTDELKETITWKIRKMDKIRSTLTLMMMEGKGE